MCEPRIYLKMYRRNYAARLWRNIDEKKPAQKVKGVVQQVARQG